MKKLKGIDGKLDDAWSELVKLQWNMRCARCRKAEYLNSHHIFSRSARSVRWDTDNGICLCAGCHNLSSSFSAHKTPTEFTYWLEGLKGREWIEALSKKASNTVKFYKSDKEDMLKSMRDEIALLKEFD